MPGDSEQFRKAVIAAGLVSARDLDQFWNSLPGSSRPATAEAFAAALVRAGRIKPEQATQLLASLGRSVVIVAAGKSESWTLKLIGGAFATIVAPVIVTFMMKYLDDRPDPPAAAPAAIPQAPAPVPQAAAPVPQATSSVAMKSPPAVVDRATAKPPEPPLVARVERPAVTVAPAKSSAASDKGTAPKQQAEKEVAPAAPKPMSWPADGKKAGGTQVEWARFLKTPPEIDNSIGMKLVLIPPGTFMMGSSGKRTMKVARALKLASELDRMRDELPRHRVNFNQGYWLGENEVTIGQFARFVAATKYVTDAERAGGENSKEGGGKQPPTWREPGYAVTNDFPVTQVSWTDAVAFCNWLSESDKLKPWYRRKNDSWVKARGADGYRLPTEAEWEYVCRAGTDEEFYFGDDPAELEKFAWFSENSNHSAQPVGQKRGNPWRLHDMHGNVREWCNDWYAADFYAESGQIDPHGPATGALRVTRGGSWYSNAVRARSGDRVGVAPTYHSNQVGFRVKRAL